MISFLLAVHEYFYGNNALYCYKKTNKIMWIISYVISLICCKSLYLYLYIIKFLNIYPSTRNSVVNQDIVVSLTSFPKRIDDVWMVVDSMCRQTMQPSIICITLSVKEFPEKEKNLPSRLLQYKKYGLKILWIENNLRPHNKYWAAMRKYSDKYIITIDDDIYYRQDLVAHLWELSQKFKDCVCTNNAASILNEDLELLSYNYWQSKNVISNYPSHNYIAKGYNGVIYPPSILKNKEAFNEELIAQTCLRADDLWLKANELINNVKVVKGDYYPTAIELSGSQKIALRRTNTNHINNENDKQWAHIDAELNITQLLQDLVRSEK
ncbi:glycosyltransferase [Phocaeicola coprophilus]|jgi:hypothetical protein|uniref:Glycosyltransferase 2-like domain-containing protein n=2 Tax=Phocaeicola coprophilus TaxID=387090 RepID=A0A413T169_9BACT|nr:glycosyltransferase [Phocaeicola coprophilus]RHA76497.1 hypothetical protein DW921_06465 [Phocaeicola coprophilus]